MGRMSRLKSTGFSGGVDGAWPAKTGKRQNTTAAAGNHRQIIGRNKKRSEERRVGKEGKTIGAPTDANKIAFRRRSRRFLPRESVTVGSVVMRFCRGS